MLTDVANAKASQVCPDGKEGLPPSATFWRIGYVMNGLGRSVPYLTMVAIVADISIEALMYNAVCFMSEFFLMKPIPNKIRGMLYAMGAAEFVILLKKSSKDVFLFRLISFKRLMSGFCARTIS